jgi:hypothetical protein
MSVTSISFPIPIFPSTTDPVVMSVLEEEWQHAEILSALSPGAVGASLLVDTSDPIRFAWPSAVTREFDVRFRLGELTKRDAQFSTAPLPWRRLAQPQWVPSMGWALRPARMDELVVHALLDVLHDNPFEYEFRPVDLTEHDRSFAYEEGAGFGDRPSERRRHVLRHEVKC